MMHGLDAAHLQTDAERRDIVLREILQICLWGNATDLSLLTNLSDADIRALQTVEADAQRARAKFIMKDDSDAVCEHVASLQGAQLDIVLDNGMLPKFNR